MYMKLLKFIYKGFMAGMPMITYNPMSSVHFHAPFTVLPDSLYINYKLTNDQYEVINHHIQESNPFFEMKPVRLTTYGRPEYYLSLNIYNCTSPLFLNDDGMTRFEINTYVTDGNKKGTLIMDYLSNALSMDPVNIFKDQEQLEYKNGKIFG